MSVEIQLFYTFYYSKNLNTRLFIVTAGDDPFLSDDEDMEKKPMLATLVTQTSMPPPAAAGLPKPTVGGTVTFAVPKVPLAPQTQVKKQTPIAIHSYGKYLLCDSLNLCSPNNNACTV